MDVVDFRLGDGTGAYQAACFGSVRLINLQDTGIGATGGASQNGYRAAPEKPLLPLRCRPPAAVPLPETKTSRPERLFMILSAL